MYWRKLLGDNRAVNERESPRLVPVALSRMYPEETVSPAVVSSWYLYDALVFALVPETSLPVVNGRVASVGVARSV